MNPFLKDIAVSTMLKERLSALSTLLKSRHILHSVALELELINDAMIPSEIEEVMRNISKSLTITQLGKDFLKIELESTKPDGMKPLLQSISNHFIEQLLAPERSSIQDSREFLAFHIKKRKEDLDVAENALAEYKNTNALLTPEIQVQSLNRLAILRQNLYQKKAELAGAQKNLGTLDQQLSKTNPVIGKIEEQIIKTRSELALLYAKYTKNHSSVQAKEREIRRLESERSELLKIAQPNFNSGQLWDIASSNVLGKAKIMQPFLSEQLHNLQMARSKFESLNEETKSLNNMILELEQKANNFGNSAKELYRLFKNVEIKRQLYDELVKRYEMAQLTGSLGIFEQKKRVKIIDLPFTPSKPSNFPPIIFAITGFLAGIFLGIGLATIVELFDTSIRRPDQLEILTEVPVITVIPKVLN
ncbi:chain length determinant protein [Candidatus Photodesmus blepharus]|uniref:Chain length determinant protein n=2 Tax=Candidatus Photodesmus blepharonis TaxID=1179155 RepID=A0A084CPL4_9GAMM|nr:chain length determinant protein [Candidatus Photodesmus blepharus]